MTGPTAPPGSPEGSDTGMPRGRLVVIFVGLILGILMAALDQTIVATALPTIARELGGLEEQAWIITIYLLTQTITIPLYGKASDLIGRKLAFQLAVAIFLVGSVVAGLAQSVGMLIAFRAVQGVGAGGLMVGAQTIMAEIVSARERGKYMSIMGPMIGVGVVFGPLLGGYLTQHASWRWIFYINVPLGLLALLIVAVMLRLPRAGRKPHVDYAGAAVLTAAVTCLVLILTWGGTSYDWASWTIGGLAVAVVALAGLWILAERRAADPVLPLHLFRDSVFRITAPLAFILGVAMFSTISYLPSYLQLSLGQSATKSGLLLLPLMGGFMLAAVITGQAISRTGRYKPFPLVGAGLATTGVYLLSLMDATTSRGQSSLFMTVLGLGIGCIIPALILTTQNSVAHRDVGGATAGVNFFRQIGASFGTALIGSLFTSRLVDQLRANLPAGALPGGGQAQGITQGLLEKLPPQVAHGVVVAYGNALTPLYRYLVPLLLLALVLAWFLPEKPLATTLGGGDMNSR